MEKMTLREFINYANKHELEEDVYVDGLDGICLVAGEIKFTEAGEKHFAAALDNCWIEDDEYIIEWNEDEATEDEEGIPAHARLALELLYALAGYCSQRDFDLWFA